MSESILQLVCNRCPAWWVEWRIDLEQPFEDQCSMTWLELVHADLPGQSCAMPESSLDVLGRSGWVPRSGAAPTVRECLPVPYVNVCPDGQFAMRTNAVGSYYHPGIGTLSRPWLPSEKAAAELAGPDPGPHVREAHGTRFYQRVEFVCPAGCPNDYQLRQHDFDAAVRRVLAAMYETRTRHARLTVDSVLSSRT